MGNLFSKLNREKDKKTFFKKLAVVSVCEVLLMVSGVLSVRAFMGMSPRNSFLYSLAELLNVSMGTATLFWNILFLVVLALFFRKVLYVGTFIDAVFAGFIFDFLNRMYGILIPNGMPEFMRFVLPLMAALFAGFTLAMMIPMEFGVTIYDGLLLFTQKLTGRSYSVACWILAGILIVASLLLGARWINQIGYGTIISSIFIGPAYDFFRVPVQKRLRLILKMDEYVQETQAEGVTDEI